MDENNIFVSKFMIASGDHVIASSVFKSNGTVWNSFQL